LSNLRGWAKVGVASGGRPSKGTLKSGVKLFMKAAGDCQQRTHLKPVWATLSHSWATKLDE